MASCPVRRSICILALSLSIAATASAQVPRWENRGQAELSGSAQAVDAAHGIVVVAAGVGDALGNSQWFVRGIDARSGKAVWEDRHGELLFGLAKDVAIEGDRAFVAGWTYTTGQGFDFVVRAYDVRTGAVAWSQAVSKGPSCVAQVNGSARCVAKAVAVADGRVFVVGHLSRTAARSDFAVIAYDAASGVPLWDSVTDPLGVGANDYAWAVAAAGDRVFVLGETGNQTGLLLQAHDVHTGAILWRQPLPGARTFTLKDTLVADRRQVIIGGSDAAQRFFVRAYDPRTGAPQWEDHLDDGAGEVSALRLDGGDGDGSDDRDRRTGAEGRRDARRLVAVGVAGCDPLTSLGCALVVRAYDPARGLLWTAKDHAEGGDWFALSLAAGDGYVAAAGLALLADGIYHPTIRTLDATTGAFRSQIRFDDEPGSAPFGDAGDVFDLAIAQHRLLAAGHLFRPDEHSDFLVREYRLDGRAPGHDHGDLDDHDGGAIGEDPTRKP